VAVGILIPADSNGVIVLLCSRVKANPVPRFTAGRDAGRSVPGDRAPGENRLGQPGCFWLEDFLAGDNNLLMRQLRRATSGATVEGMFRWCSAEDVAQCELPERRHFRVSPVAMF
jgi:hypothetical protein